MGRLVDNPIVAAYANLLDGIRGHFARTEGDDLSASYSAVLAATALLGVDLVAAINTIDLLFHQHLSWGSGRLGKIEVVVPAIVFAGGITYLTARSGGLLQRRGPAQHSHWKRYLLWWSLFTVVLIAAPLAIITWRKWN